MTIEYSGERFIPGLGGTIETEHLHRYELARLLASGLDVLDIASGEGYGTHVLSAVARSVTGVDINAQAVVGAQEKYAATNLRYVHGNCTNLPLKSASIDLVVSFETIEHHDQHDEMLREIRRVLRPGGVLLISSPNRPEYDKTLSQPNDFHVKELDFTEFAALLATHFRHAAFYAQRVVAGSIIVPYQHYAPCFVDFVDSNPEHCERELTRPVYFVALAGDGDLPSLHTSLYESESQLHSNLATELLEARVYVSEAINGKVQPYGEDRARGRVYRLHGTRTTVEIELPTDLQPLERLRLDIANAPAAIALHALSLQSADGSELWRWSGNCDSFVNPGGIVARPAADGAILLCINDDPQFDLVLPAQALALIRGGAVLRIELTPHPLLDYLPTALQHIGAVTDRALPVLAGVPIAAGLSKHLEEIAGLLKIQIDDRNRRIAAQHAEIESLKERQRHLYEQVIRAEAQLDLLKEFSLPEANTRRERL